MDHCGNRSMSEACECLLTGWCERHGMHKNAAWHKLCASSDKYRQAWDDNRGPGQKHNATEDERFERKSRLKNNVELQRRIVGWLKFFKVRTDLGIGDTIARLLSAASNRHTITVDLEKLQMACSCDPVHATELLNEHYPFYATPCRPPVDGRLVVLDTPPAIEIKQPTSNKAVVVIAPDVRPRAELMISGPLIKKYAERFGADYIEVLGPFTTNHACSSKWILSQIASHYDQTLLIDADIIPMRDAPSIFDEVPIGYWGMVDDLPRVEDCGGTEWMKREWSKVCKHFGGEIPLTHAWNSGLVVAPRNAIDHYHPPPMPVPNFWCTEQHWHTYCLLKGQANVTNLDGIWQAGFPWKDFAVAVKKAWFVHLNGSYGPHELRLQYMRHFATGSRVIPRKLINATKGKVWTPWWLRDK